MISVVGMIQSAFQIMLAVISLVYLGWTFSEDGNTIERSDWKRKFIIFFAWVSLVASGLMFIVGGRSPASSL